MRHPQVSYPPSNVKVIREHLDGQGETKMVIGELSNVTLECVAAAAETIGMRPALLALRLLQGDVNVVDLFERVIEIDTEYGQQLAKSA